MRSADHDRDFAGELRNVSSGAQAPQKSKSFDPPLQRQWTPPSIRMKRRRRWIAAVVPAAISGGSGHRLRRPGQPRSPAMAGAIHDRSRTQSCRPLTNRPRRTQLHWSRSMRHRTVRPIHPRPWQPQAPTSSVCRNPSPNRHPHRPSSRKPLSTSVKAGTTASRPPSTVASRSR